MLFLGMPGTAIFLPFSRYIFRTPICCPMGVNTCTVAKPLWVEIPARFLGRAVVLESGESVAEVSGISVVDVS